MQTSNGARINGRYIIDGILGTGGQGTVYRVFDILEGNLAKALKILSHPSMDAELRFEFAQSRRLDHPHVARVFELGRVNEIEGAEAPRLGWLFFTQELVAGEPAGDWMQSEALRGADLVTAVARIGVAAASALHAAHRASILHRDVKPANILVGAGGDLVKLIDFGLASPKDFLKGKSGGTLGFVAEEALAGYGDERSDIYSLGVTLTALATGRNPSALFPPFHEEILRAFSSSFSAVARVVERMCEGRPEARYQTAQEAAVALAAAAAGNPLEMVMGTASTPASRRDGIADFSGFRTPRVQSPKLVGRGEELQRLEAWLAGPSDILKTCTIAGPPGVGKSRLFKTAVTARQLRATEEGGDPPEFICGPLRQVLTAMMTASGKQNPAVQQWVDGISRTKEVQGEATEEMLAREVADVFFQFTRNAAVFIEAGETGFARVVLKKLGRFHRMDGPAPAVCVELRDPSVTDGEDGAAGGETLALSIRPLDVEAESDLTARVLGRRPSLSTAKRIHQVTGGIPLMTEALLLALLTLRPDADLESVEMETLFMENDPVDAAVNGFLCSLDEKARDLTLTLAVIDRPMPIDGLCSLLHREDESEVVRTLQTLARNGFADLENGVARIKPHAARRMCRKLNGEQAMNLHRRALLAADTLGTVPPWRIADHADAAGLSDRARDASRAAYEVLLETGDLGSAAVYLARALSYRAFSNAEQDRMIVQLARLFRQTGDYGKVLETAASVPIGNAPFYERAQLEQASALRLLGRTEEALGIFRSLENAGDPAVQIGATVMLARMDLERGQPGSAKSRMETIDLNALPTEGRAELSAAVGLAAYALADYEKADAVFTVGLAEATAAQDARSAARFSGLLGMLRHRTFRFEEAVRFYHDAAGFAKSAKDRHGDATFTVNLAAAHTELGHIKEALDAYRDGLPRLRNFGRPEETAGAGANLAELLLRMGDLEGADAASQAAEADARQIKGAIPAFVLSVRGDILLALRRFDQARSVLEEAEVAAETKGAGQERMSVKLHLASLSIEVGDFTRAGGKLQEAAAENHVAGSLFDIELKRLQLRLVEARGEDVAASLTALTAALPSRDALLNDAHLKAYVAAAQAASRAGKDELAITAAKTAKDISLRVQEKTPSLYRKKEPPFLKEINMILQSEQKVIVGGIQTSEWEQLARINMRLNSEFRVGRLLEMIMDAALDITRAERGFLLIAGKEGDLKIRCARNMDKESLSLEQEGFSRGAALKAYQSKEPLFTTDAKEDDRFMEMKSVANFNLRYIAAVPLLVDGKAAGTIYLDSKRAGRFDDSRIALIEALANQAAIALTNARLRVEIERRQQRIERLNRDLASKLERREGELKAVKHTLEKQTDALIGKYRYEEIIARSKPMAEVFRLLDKVVTADFPVLIEGESGTGKELAARAVHYNSARKKKPFVAENCAAIPEALMESVLFGHVKGAFTGAVSDSRGLFVEADGGTLFLDEVSELSLGMQAKLLRVLQNNEIRPVGGAKSRKVNVRVLTATNADPAARVADGRFREDLFYRLNVIRIVLPPLRERREDILLLTDHFLKKHGDGNKRISKAAAEVLLNHSWPGNIRQLENEVIRSVVLSDEEILPEHLSQDLLNGLHRFAGPDTDLNIVRQVDQLKKRLLRTALGQSKGNQTAAAALLGLSRFGLQKMMKRLGV